MAGVRHGEFEACCIIPVFGVRWGRDKGRVADWVRCSRRVVI